ncbi:MAG: S8 family serine peptidase [Salinivirgaceae bacterium]|nr:S8 family serine peptidase [Salinivirgaceae bacterium]
MKRKTTHLFTPLFILLFIGAMQMNAQTKSERDIIISKTNVERLNTLKVNAEIRFKEEKQNALKIAAEKNWVVRKDVDGQLIELMKISKEGTPLYYTTFNKYAAIATRANTLHNGGIAGLNLEGQGMTAHVWDGGLALTTHNEYDGIGGETRFSIGDGTTALHYHSAHVTGTIIASGVQAEAKGMAPQAHAVGFDWNSDLAEATEEAANGMLISNHSYGWRASDVPDWYFGAYLDDSRCWDELMYNAPYYLMVVAAGNDGTDNSSNGNPLNGNSGYDKLTSHATSKNNIVVANAREIGIDASGNFISASINSSSSQGPTDDYRIKPDITGKGTSLYSTVESSNSAYSSLTGTSMASPNVSGTLLLLQQHYSNINATFMRAATLKGLALHTADDVGPSGPDAVYGWGLLNAKRAAEVISSKHNGSIINELTLSQDQTYLMDVLADGSTNLEVSISWTDAPGQINNGVANSTTPALVNDLDVRVLETTNTYFPFRLTSITTNGTGDNLVDPYEKIIVANPIAGKRYTIQVSHKGQLFGNQNFTLIITGITGTSPHSFTAVSSHPNAVELSWSKNENQNNVILAMSSNGIFGNPLNQSTYNVNDAIPGGGIVLHNGSETSFTHASLTENTTYYYKIWSLLPSGDYSAGIYANETTIKSTPTAYPTNFMALAPSGTVIPLTWNDAVGSVVPDGYLVKASIVGFNDITPPVNGVMEANTRLIKNVSPNEQTIVFDSLIGVTTYYFKIFPYTNSGSNVTYKTSGMVPEASAQTEADPCEGITLPYFMNFDDGDNCWNGITGNDSWINVTPTTPAGDHTGGGTCFVTNGNSDYKTGSIYDLISPKISLYGFDNCELTFWIYMNAELASGGNYWDGGYIECYNGSTWTKETTSLPYHGPLSSGNPLRGELGWSPSSILNWTQVTVDLSDYNENPDFRFRIRFGSDAAAVGAGWAVDDVSITGTPSCTPPASQATNLVVGNQTFNSMTVEWNRGTPDGGDNVLVVACDVNAEHIDPTKGNIYEANAIFGEGSEIGNGNFVIYDGAGTSVDVTGLLNLTSYRFSVYEYSNADHCYNLIELSGVGTTEPKPAPSAHVANFQVETITPFQISLSWVDALGSIEPDGYTVFASTSNTFDLPTNAIDNDLDMSDGFGVINVAYGIEVVTFDGLDFSTEYFFKIFPFTNHGDQILYKTDGNVPSASAITLIDPCSIAIIDLPHECTFSETVAPQCWDVIDNTSSGEVWKFGTIGSINFGSGNYAYLNSDGYGSGHSQNSDLITPQFDLSMYVDVTLSFNHYYKHISSSSASLYYSIDNGTTWTQIQQWTSTTSNPSSFSELLGAVNGQSQVRFKFSYSGNWAYYWCIDNVKVTGTVACTPPSDQATSFVVSGQTSSSVDVGWTRGTPDGGNAVLVIAHEGSAVNSNPIAGTSYTAHADFGAGSIIGTNNYVVYNGTETNVVVTGLKGNSTYHFSIHEYNTSTNCYKSPGLTGIATTTEKAEPSNHVTSFSATGGASSVLISWVDAVGDVLPDGYLIVANTSGTFTEPTDGIAQNNDLDFSDNAGVVNVPQGTESYILGGLNSATEYFFRIYPYTNNGTAINYKTNGNIPEVNATTFYDPCLVDLNMGDYIENFDGVTIPNLPVCTSAENTNDDNYEWITSAAYPYSGAFHLSIRYNGSLAMNDWFFSQPLLLESGFEYKVTFMYRAHSSSYAEKLEVKLGTSNSSESMTIEQIYDNNNISSTSYAQAEATFIVTQSGTYYLGWHGYSDANMYNLYIDDISVSKVGDSNTAPVVENPISDVVIDEGFETFEIPLASVFYDADGDELSYTALSDNLSTVTVNVVDATLWVTEVAVGAANISVTASDGHGNSVVDVFSFTVDSLVSIDSRMASNILIHPNPAHNIVYIDLKEIQNNDVVVEILDINGALLYSEKLNLVFDNQTNTINISQLSGGIYLFKIYNHQFVHFEKVIIK